MKGLEDSVAKRRIQALCASLPKQHKDYSAAIKAAQDHVRQYLVK